MGGHRRADRAVVVVGAVATAAAAAQANALLFPRAPRLVSAIALTALWSLPFFANRAAASLGIEFAVTAEPFVRATNPAATIAVVAAPLELFAPPGGSDGSIEVPLGAIFAVGLFVALAALIRHALAELRAQSAELVALPAGDFRPPGAVRDDAERVGRTRSPSR